MKDREAFEAWYSRVESSQPSYAICLGIWQAAAAAERERCAKVCEAQYPDAAPSMRMAVHRCATAIRKETT